MSSTPDSDHMSEIASDGAPDGTLGQTTESPPATTSLISPRSLQRRLIWVISGLGVFCVVALITVLVVLGPQLSRSYVRLDSSNPAYIHPDGMVIGLSNTADSARVHVETVPRELFLSDEASQNWVEARTLLPGDLLPLSPLYTIQTRGAGLLTAEMAVPNGAEPLVLMDLYRWDEDSKQWLFVPSRVDPARGVVIFEPTFSPMTVMAVHSLPGLLSVGLIVSEGATLPDSIPYSAAMPEGLSLNAQGDIVGTPVQATASTVLPVVANRATGFNNYGDTRRQAILTSQLMALAPPYQGLVLDFDPASGYPEFVAALAEQMHAHGKYLHVVVRGSDLAAYNLPEMAQSADHIWLAPGDDPNIYLPGDGVSQIIESAISLVDRSKLGLWVGGLNVDVASGSVVPISLDQALGLFGDVQVAGQFDSTLPIEPGSSLPFRLTGAVESMGFDIPLGMNYLTYRDTAGQMHYVYFSSAQNLTRKVAWARFYGLDKVAIDGIAHPQATEGLAEGLQAFLNQQPVGSPEALSIIWHVETTSGATLDARGGDLSMIQYLWQALVDPGQYVVRAGINVEATQMSRGEVVVQVAQSTAAPTLTPTPSPTPRPGILPTRDPNSTPGPTQAAPTPQQSSGVIAAGMFELGGQTQSFSYPGEMSRAGMTWVKFQHKWNPGDDATGAVGGRIADAHARGFKVLLSIPGPEHPSSIDYDAYTRFVAGVAALGPDAIEIWNEMNFNREWPANEIDGANYVNKMLAPAYQASKAANPGVMVISGAPTPTGAFGGCGSIQTPGGAITGCDDWFYLQQMRDAGAASYLDCVGVHYNEGIIPPSQTSGDPRGDNFYSRYFYGMMNTYSILGKPLCFTELGYLSPEGYGQLPANFAWAQNTTVAQHAQWLAEAAVLSSQSGKVRLMIIFNVDFTYWGSDPQAGYAMIRPGGGCPACDALAAVQR